MLGAHHEYLMVGVDDGVERGGGGVVGQEWFSLSLSNEYFFFKTIKCKCEL